MFLNQPGGALPSTLALCVRVAVLASLCSKASWPFKDPDELLDTTSPEPSSSVLRTSWHNSMPAQTSIPPTRSHHRASRCRPASSRRRQAFPTLRPEAGSPAAPRETYLIQNRITTERPHYGQTDQAQGQVETVCAVLRFASFPRRARVLSSSRASRAMHNSRLSSSAIRSSISRMASGWPDARSGDVGFMLGSEFAQPHLKRPAFLQAIQSVDRTGRDARFLAATLRRALWRGRRRGECLFAHRCSPHRGCFRTCG